MRRALLAAVILLVSCGGGSSTYAPPGPQPAASGTALPPIPEVVASGGIAALSLKAVVGDGGYPAFAFNGAVGLAPTIRVHPGDSIVIDDENALPGGSDPMAAMTNLHFHGLRVSPQAPADDVLSMMAMPGERLHYVVPIPLDQEPGLYWYHPHPHGHTRDQVGRGGMSGAIIVEGLQQHLPALNGLRERVLVVRSTGASERLEVNGVVRPAIDIAPGEAQFFRVVNATSYRYLDLAVDGESMQLVALDGVALDAFRGTPATRTVSDVVVPPAGRAEFVVVGGSSATVLRTRSFNSGPAGDPDPDTILADIRPRASMQSIRRAPLAWRVGASLPQNVLSAPLPAPAATRIVRFTEDGNGFYLNGKRFNPADPPQFDVQSGTVEEWTIANYTDEVHAFHLHQVHFATEAIDNAPVQQPVWLDTMNVAARHIGANGSSLPGTVKVLVDFRDPIVRGTFMMHCHILEHEDNGMMATARVR